MLTCAEIDALVERIVARMRPERVIVFGSYVKNTLVSGSDLDLLVVVDDTPLPMANRADDVRPILSGVLVDVDVHVYTQEEVTEYGQEEGSFLHSVLTSGRTVFARSAAPG